ncbi:glycosyltransferase family 2 protein [Gaoshiqia sediminis]|uniref:Glycosyltransferase family 2 protein n=1 Tax=Gaoshiqia sediminis TaxID=2986998 RepID=A0AA41Y7A9_9BACT|nr:glycosyltransferase family 2 protein [Gaoshiqia sediminis]MCW0483180.1 glycosyltransferase family 2 protein [Gaoshiqia sediminis]
MQEYNQITIAVLLTCHNRRKKTLNCLESLYSAKCPTRQLDVFLVDDGSTDGTGEAIKFKFPKVVVIQGTGNLYWNQGMRLAWDTASKSRQYDFYLWLNDDTLVKIDALIELIQCFQEAMKKDQKPAIITGACESTENKNIFSYGGKTDLGPVIPNGTLQPCKYINGNVVLVSNVIFNELGNLSPDYTHAMGDFDYGLRAIKAGYRCYTTKSYIAICPTNPGIPAWCNPNTPLLQRLRLLKSPKGLNIKEYNIFRKRFWGWKWIIYALKAYLKILYPSLYFKISSKSISDLSNIPKLKV